MAPTDYIAQYDSLRIDRPENVLNVECLILFTPTWNASVTNKTMHPLILKACSAPVRRAPDVSDILLTFINTVAGKTSLLRRFTATLNPSLFNAVYFPLSTVTVADFYRGLALGLGQEPKFRKVDMFGKIQQAILNLFHNQRITPVLILNKIQMASNQFLNDISLLFNFAMDSKNPFVLIMIGLPHFMKRLKLSHNEPLAQRVIMRY